MVLVTNNLTYIPESKIFIKKYVIILQFQHRVCSTGYEDEWA